MLCRHCEIDFVPPRADAVFCSSRCRSRAHYIANREAIKNRARDWAIANPERRRETWQRKYDSRAGEMRARSQQWRAGNKERHRAYTKAWNGRNPERVRARQLRKYGITQVEYDAMLVAQGGLCQICRTDTPSSRRKWFDVDHCHSTGRVRGLLCEICNRVVGLMKDDPERLERAAQYLRESHDASRLSQRRPAPVD